MSGPVVRKATKEDIEKFSDMPEKPTINAYVGELDGEIIALGGLAFVQGRWHIFCDLKPEARKYKIKIMRTAIRVMAEAREKGIRFVYADADPNEEKAIAWMTRLGFELDPRSNVLYRWRS